MLACHDCGALVADIDGPTHRYIGASAGCWHLFGEVQARGYVSPGFGDDRMMLINSYMTQHPGEPSPQAIQSVAAHLIGLYVVVELGYDGRGAITAVARAADGSELFGWLEPPPPDYTVTIVDLHQAQQSDEFRHNLNYMAHSTWEMWAGHHETVRGWARELRIAP